MAADPSDYITTALEVGPSRMIPVVVAAFVAAAFVAGAAAFDVGAAAATGIANARAAAEVNNY